MCTHRSISLAPLCPILIVGILVFLWCFQTGLLFLLLCQCTLMRPSVSASIPVSHVTPWEVAVFCRTSDQSDVFRDSQLRFRGFNVSLALLTFPVTISVCFSALFIVFLVVVSHLVVSFSLYRVRHYVLGAVYWRLDRRSHHLRNPTHVLW